MQTQGSYPNSENGYLLTLSSAAHMQTQKAAKQSRRDKREFCSAADIRNPKKYRKIINEVSDRKINKISKIKIDGRSQDVKGNKDLIAEQCKSLMKFPETFSTSIIKSDHLAESTDNFRSFPASYSETLRAIEELPDTGCSVLFSFFSLAK